MTETMAPFSLILDTTAFQSFEGATKIVRRLGDMKNLYADKESVESILVNENPLIYEVWEADYGGSGRGLSFGITCIHPGKIGREYYMTKGHFHTTDADELCVVLRGQGILLSQTRNGETQAIDMNPGSLFYVPGRWAHRVVNTGQKDLIFLSIWPPKIGHDYDTIAQNGFQQLAVEGTDGPMIVRNPSFSRSQDD